MVPFDPFTVPCLRAQCIPIRWIQAEWAAIEAQLLRNAGVAEPPEADQERTQLLLEKCTALVSPALDYVFDAITLTRHKLEGKVPLIGTCECFSVPRPASRCVLTPPPPSLRGSGSRLVLTRTQGSLLQLGTAGGAPPPPPPHCNALPASHTLVS